MSLRNTFLLLHRSQGNPARLSPVFSDQTLPGERNDRAEAGGLSRRAHADPQPARRPLVPGAVEERLAWPVPLGSLATLPAEN